MAGTTNAGCVSGCGSQLSLHPRRPVSSASVSPDAVAPLLQEAPHRRVGFEADGAVVGFLCRVRVTETAEQTGPRGPVGLILREATVI